MTALFSGDTVLASDAWGAAGWARVWGRHAGRLMREMHGEPLYWLLLTATHRTYGFLHAFLKEYFPCPEKSTPSVLGETIDALVSLKFPQEYDRATGVVRPKKPMPVRPELIAKSAIDQAPDEHSAFFADLNPGYLNGDYLVCLGDLSERNRTRLGHKFFAAEERSD